MGVTTFTFHSDLVLIPPTVTDGKARALFGLKGKFHSVSAIGIDLDRIAGFG